MRIWAEARERMNALIGRSRDERDMNEELQFHLAMETEKNRRSGMGAEEARRRARLDFGGVETAKEELREARGVRPLDDLAADVRFALRHFRRMPLVTATMVLVLALGIGANTALFTVVQSAMTLPAPGIPRDEALVRIRGIEQHPLAGPRGGIRWLSYPEFLQIAQHDEFFSSVAAWSTSTAELAFDDPDQLAVSGDLTYVTSNYFTVLGVTPEVGTGFPPLGDRGDASAALIGVISHAVWMRHFGGSGEAIGKILKVKGQPITVVGVAPPRFAGVNGGGQELGVWVPLAAWPVIERSSASFPNSYDAAILSAVGRLRPGVTEGAATTTVNAIAEHAGDETQRYQQDERIVASSDVVPLVAGNESPRSAGYVLAAGTRVAALTLLILLITCANVGGLLVGVASGRRREIAVRLSLGATRTRVIRQLLAESVLLSVAAGLIGIAILWSLIGAFGVHVPDLQLALDVRVAAFTFGLATVTGILFGLSPAFHATRLSVGEVLKDSAAAVSGSRSWLQRGFVVAQIALTQPLLVGLGTLLLVILGTMSGRASPAHYESIVSLQLGIFDRATSFTGDGDEVDRRLARRRADVERLTERLAGLPGVTAAVPQFAGYMSNDWALHPADRTDRSRYRGTFRGIIQPAPFGYFRLMEIPIVRGRDFTEAENHLDATSVIVSEDLARDLWGRADPIGRRLTDADGSGEFIVVGVVDERRAGMSQVTGNDPLVYVPFVRIPDELLIRTLGSGEAMMPSIRAATAEEAPEIPILRITTLADLEAETRRTVALITSAAGAGGMLALLLSAIGLYAVISLAVGHRQREIGIRMALGANASRVVRLFLTSGLRLCLVGVAIGLPLSLFALHILAQLVGAPRASTALLAALIATFVFAVAGIATWIPARRAAVVDPMTVLRNE